MNTIWSTYIQSIDTLYLSRTLRFSDLFHSLYQSAFSLQDGGKILEIGCGPGALAQSLLRWYPHSQICGIDRDSSFIAFARQNAPGIQFQEGDATALPFAADSFDVTISNTVAEHIEPAKFYGEQYRVLKPGGVCLVLSSRKGIHVPAPCIAQETSFEQELWQRVDPCFQKTHAKYNVCEYPQNEAELPLAMEKFGFKSVTTDYVTISLTPDHPHFSPKMAHAIIQANRQNDLANAENMLRIAPNAVTGEEVDQLKQLINDKYNQRLRLYDQRIKQWDTQVLITMVIRGVK